MRRRYAISALLLPQLATSSPFSSFSPSSSISSDAPDESYLIDLQNSTLQERGDSGCAVPCGYYGQLCCAVGQYCYTDSNQQAQCGNSAATTTAAAQAGSGYWQYYTSTWVETELVTMTTVYSSWIPATSTYCPPSATAYATAAPLYCNWNNGETSCGNICCSSGQYCVTSGQCGTSGQSYSAPLRPTSGTLIIATATLPTTTTVPYLAPMATGQSANITATSADNGGLSGGAIAGIVVGVIAGIILLILLLLFLCFKSIWDACFGRRRKTRRETVEYSSYRHEGGRSGNWYGSGYGPRRSERREEKKKSGLSGWATAAAALGGLGLALGLRKHEEKKKRRQEEKSDYSSDYYSSYYTDSSSDRRTRDTRRTYSRSRRG